IVTDAGVRAWHIIRAMTAAPDPITTSTAAPAVEKPPASSMKIYLRLLGYTRPFLGYFALSILGFAIAGGCKAALASVLKYFIDGLAAPDAPISTGLAWLDTLDLVLAIPVMIVVIALLEGLGTFLGNYGISRVSLGLIHDLRTQLFGSFLVLPNRFYDANNSGHLVSKLTYNVSMVTDAATDAVKILFREGLTVIAPLSYLRWMNWRLTLTLLVVLPAIAWLVSNASRTFRRLSKSIQTSMGEVTHVASETIQGYRVVRSSGGEGYERARFVKASTDNTKRQLKMVRTQETFSALMHLIVYSSMGLLLFTVLKVRGD